jgi:membrane protease YdiL (CAAX protease family)
MSSIESPPAAAGAASTDLAPTGGGGDPSLPSWPPWSAAIALVAGLAIALVGALLIDIPAALFGVSLNTKNLPPGLEIADTLVQDAGFVAGAVLVAQWGGRAVNAWQFGLRPTPARRAAWLVAATIGAFLLFSAIWAAALGLHGKEKLLDQLGANQSALLLVLSAGLTTVVAPMCEEFLFRGYMFTALRGWRGPWVAAVITGVVFGAVHASSAPAAYLVPLSVLGFGLCLLYWRTDSLYPCIAAHSINNSLAFGTLESWTWWQVATLMVSALVVLTAFALALRALGVLSDTPPPPPDTPAQPLSADHALSSSAVT